MVPGFYMNPKNQQGDSYKYQTQGFRIVVELMAEIRVELL